MSDKRPFWHEEDEPDSPTETPDNATDTRKDWSAEWVDAEVVRIPLQNTETGETFEVELPYDPNNRPSEDELIAEAQQFLANLEHMRAIVNADAVAQLAETIKADEDLGAGIVRLLAEAFKQPQVRLHPTEDSVGNPSRAFIAQIDEVASEDLGALEQEINRLFRETATTLIESVADSVTFNEHGETFWQAYARDAIAHALRVASDIAEAELGTDASDDEHEARAEDLYQDGELLSWELANLAGEYTRQLGEAVTEFLKLQVAEAGKGQDEGNIFDTLLEKSRDSLRKTVEADKASEQRAIDHPPAFVDGYGRVHSDPVSAGMRLALVDLTNWAADPAGRPGYSFGNASGQALYALSAKSYPSAAAAWQAVEQYGDAHADLFDYILAKMLASKANHTRDIYGDFRLTPEEVLEARGIKKHQNGGYRPEDVADIIAQISDLTDLEVRAEIKGFERASKGKRGKPKETRLEHAVPVIAVNETLYRTSLAGERTPIAWQLRPGNWARTLEQFTPQYAHMMQGILRLHAKNDRNAKRIGRFLVFQYRIRANQQSWGQPYRISDLLANAGISIDRQNPARFRGRIEAALKVLSSPEEMEGAVCVQSWSYPAPVAAAGRGWFDAWLDSGIVILPPETITTQYKALGSSRKRPQRASKLASGGPEKGKKTSSIA